MREYTGLRYVPIFEGEFIPNRAYENLSIVQYQGEIYVSKQPTNGEAITNTEYWVKMPWNDYTTQIYDVTNRLNQYKSQNDAAVTGIQTELDDLSLTVQEIKPTAPKFTTSFYTTEIINYIPHNVDEGEAIYIYDLYEAYPNIFATYTYLRRVYWISPTGRQKLVNDEAILVEPGFETVFLSNGTYAGGTFLLIFCPSGTDSLTASNTIAYPVPQLPSSEGWSSMPYFMGTNDLSTHRCINAIPFVKDSTRSQTINYYRLKTYFAEVENMLGKTFRSMTIRIIVGDNSISEQIYQPSSLTDTVMSYRVTNSSDSNRTALYLLQFLFKAENETVRLQYPI